MFTHRQAIFTLVAALVFSLAFVVIPPVPKFDYDFEQFFPQDDEGLEFYRQYAENFGGDNDYLLLTFENGQESPWESPFLRKFQALQQKIQKLPRVDTVGSVLDLRQAIAGPFGFRFRKIVQINQDTVNLLINEEMLRETVLSKDGRGLLLLVRNEHPIKKEDGDRLYEQIRDSISESGLQLRAVAGKIQTQRDFVALMQAEFGFFFALSLLVMLSVLLLLFRTWWAVWIPVLAVGLGVLWAFGLILWLGKSLALLSIMQPTIFLIVGLSSLVHFFAHLVKLLQDGVEAPTAIRGTFQLLIVPVSLTVVTTALGFFSLWFTSVPALRDFGWTTGLGILIVYLAIVSLAPGLLWLSSNRIKPPPKSHKKWMNLAPLFLWVLTHKKSILSVFFILSLVSIFFGTQLRINGYLLDNLPDGNPIREDFRYFDQQFGGSNPLEISLKAGSEQTSLWEYEVLQEIEKVENKLRQLFGEKQFFSPLTLLRSLNQSINQGDSKAYRFPSRGQWLRMKPYVHRFAGSLGGEFIDREGKWGRISSRLPDFGSWEMGQKRRLFQKFCKEELDPTLLDVEWTGTAYLIDRGHQSVTSQMGRGLGIAFLLVGLIAGVLFKSWRISFLVLIPNTIPLIGMLGFMYILGIEFKLTTAILFTVAFGIAVDDTIHFMSRLRMELGRGRAFLYAIKRTFLETGQALVLSTMILISGFVMFVGSDFGVSFYSGVLISCALLVALLADLLLLPLLLIGMKQVWESKNAREKD